MNQMKCSVSMTSLESPQKQLRTPEAQQKKQWPGVRQCCSLNAKKPRRTLDKNMWRRSWGSNNEDSSQEEFWKICQQSVQELVEANSDEQGLRHFLENYSNICEWLNSVQIERGRFLDAFRLSQLAEDMMGKHHWRVEVNDTAKNLSRKYPNLKEEFQWRLKHLNSQWDALEKILSRQQTSYANPESISPPNNEGPYDLEWVRGWLRQKENELQPLDFRTEWTQQLLEHEINRYKSLQAEIEEKASAIHGALRQCQSLGRSSTVGSQVANCKENSKRSRLETRWLQLRLRVLEWVQHLSGVAERQKNLKKGRRSDTYYSVSNWDSDGDSNEPLRKCPKFDDGDSHQTNHQLNQSVPIVPTSTCDDEELISTGNLSNISEEPVQQKQPVQFLRRSSSPIPYKEEEQQRYYLNSTIICNQRQLAEQVVPNPSSILVSQHHHEQVLLLNQQQQLQQKGKEQRECQHAESVTLDEVDCDMGQSHDSENVFSQSESQFANSVVEFTFDGSQCVGMKRKLSSSPSASPPLTPSSALQFQQAVPRNISIYYFKHSDTEPEPNNQLNKSGNANIRGNRHQSSTTTSSSTSKSPKQNRRLSRTHCENSAIRQTQSESKLANYTTNDSSGGFGSVNRTSRHHFCQKSRLFLDFDQEFEDDITSLKSLKSYDEISFGIFDLDLDEDLEEGADGVILGEQEVVEGDQLNHHQLNQHENYSMMDLEGNYCADTTGTASDEPEQNSFNNSNNINNKSNSTTAVNTNNSSNKSAVRIDEIEELVQKAELLVQKTTRSRGVDCVDLPVGSSEEEDDDETLMLPQKHCGDHQQQHVHHYHHHHHHHQHQQEVLMITSGALTSSSGCGIGGSSGEIARGNSNGSGHGSQELLLSPSSSTSTSFHASSSTSYSVRKCSVSSNVSSSSASAHKLVKSAKTTATTLSSLSSWGMATVGGADSGLSSSNINNNATMSNVNNGSPKGTSIVGFASSSTSASNNVANGESGVAANKTSKKNARVRQWIRAHNSEIVVNQKNTSSCDASAESASDSEYSSSDSEQPVSSDDPTTVSTSTFLHQTHAALLETNAKNLSTCSSTNNISGSGTALAYCIGAAAAAAASLSPSTLKLHRSPVASSSETGTQTLSPFSGIGPGASGTVPLRSKKRLSYGKQRPKSFTDTLEPSVPSGPTAGPSTSTWLRTSPSYFVSDSAINLLGNRSNSSSGGSGSSSGGDCACSPGNSNVDSPSHAKRKGSSRFKRRSQKRKRKALQYDEAVVDETEQKENILQSSSITESASSPASGDKSQPSDGADQSSVTTSSPKPNFLISGPLSHIPFSQLNSDNGSVNTEELNIGLNDQADWDSYQEKYLSEPYSEEPYDPDGTLKLLAFGEDYGQYLDRADSESSSMLSGFEPADSRKRRALKLANRGEMADSDSDREELNYLLRQSNSQLNFINTVFRSLISKAESSGEAPGKYAEMEATCDENIGSLKLILTNVESTENLPFEIDVKAIEDTLEKWHIVREKIRQAANIHHIKEEMGDLKTDFSNVQSLFCTCKQFDITNMDSLKEKIRSIEGVLNELPTRKLQLQSLNDASLKTQVFLDDQDTVNIIKRQLNELYVLYEDNLQLGTFLLEKMRFLQDAWEQFEKEKQDFEKSVTVSSMRKLRKELSSSASTDSGHGTDFSHDSSISDSDMDFQERHKKLVALKERAKKVKAFLPPGSPVLDILDQSVQEAEKGLTSLSRPTTSAGEIIDLKSLYPRKKPFIYRRTSGQKSPKSKLLTPVPKRMTRRWTVVKRMVMFNVALMGIFLAAAYFLHPKCCEFTNTFCFSLVPQLTHESLPPI